MRIIPKSLPRSQYAIALFQAGRFIAAREYWLLQARSTIEERALYVSFARNSHRAFMNAMKLVNKLAERGRVAA